MATSVTRIPEAPFEACIAALRRLPGVTVRLRGARQDGADGPGGGPDRVLQLGAGSRVARFRCEWEARVSMANLAAVLERLARRGRRAARNAPILLAASVSPEAQDRLRHRRISFVDAAGNGFLEGGGLWVWVEGRSRAVSRPSPARAFRPAGLRVIYVLLREPAAIDGPYRDLARLSEVAVGGVGAILAGLRDAGFLEDTTGRGRRMRRLPDLLDRWTTGYLESLRPRLLVGTYRQAPGARLDDLLDVLRREGLGRELQVGGELGAALFTGEASAARATLHWAPSPSSGAPQALPDLLRVLQLVPDPRGSVTLLRRFGAWSEASGTPSGAGAQDGIALADPLLLRAEILAGEPDDRLARLSDVLLGQSIQVRWPS